MIKANQPAKRDWQCSECGHVLRERQRPGYCPDCNCVDGDRPMGVRLFLPEAACGWHEDSPNTANGSDQP